VVEQWIIPQGDSNLDSGQLVEALIEQQHIVAAPPGMLECLLAGSGPRNLVFLLREHGFERAAHPFVGASDQNHEVAQIRVVHDVATGIFAPPGVGGFAGTGLWRPAPV